jgi:nucleotide-binding universal stress UspA family protein
MAPEQILGVRCDPRSDIFAFWGILYHLATGRLPFGNPATLAQLRRRIHEQPTPPRGLVAETPEWLQEIILRCLEIDARDRYGSAAEVAFDLANSGQVALTERGSRNRRAGLATRFRAWMHARHFEPAPCPPLSIDIGPAPIVLVALDCARPDEPMFAALRDAAQRLIASDNRCRIACITAVPPAATLSGEDTATGRHIKHLVDLRRWAKPLQLPEERLTYHVLESEKPAAALVEYARMNEADQILIGASRGGAPTRLFPGISAQVVAEAPCSVTVVRPRPQS